MAAAIVVPLDGSDRAERALGPAMSLATGLGAEIELVRSTWEVPPTRAPEYLDRVAGGVAVATVSTEVAPAMFPAPAIVEALSAHPDSVVCMSTHGRTRVGALFDSVTQEVLESVTSPIVLIGPRCEDPAPPITGGTTVVCFDGSAASASIEPIVGEWAPALDMHVHLVTVLHNLGHSIGCHEAGPTRTRAESLACRLRARGVDVRVVFLDGRDPARTIVDYAADQRCGLIVTATRGDRLTQALLGSVAMWIIRRSTCPVLVRRPT